MGVWGDDVWQSCGNRVAMITMGCDKAVALWQRVVARLWHNDINDLQEGCGNLLN